MQAILKINHTEYAVNLSGNEIDLLTKILTKASMADHTAIGGVEAVVIGNPVKYEIKVVSAMVVTEEQATAWRKVEAQKTMTKLVEAGNIKDIMAQLYYTDVISYDEREGQDKPFTYSGTEEDGVLLFSQPMGDGDYVKVSPDGTALRFIRDGSLK